MGCFMTSFLPLMTGAMTRKWPLLKEGSHENGRENGTDVSLTTTCPLRLCSADLSESVLRCPAAHSASR
jgi:hypothetical protein